MPGETVISWCLLLLLRGCSLDAAPRVRPAVQPREGGAEPTHLPSPAAGRARDVREHSLERPEADSGGLLWTRNP